MTETALNERIAELQENNSETAHQRQKERRRLRRIIGVRKTDKELPTIRSGTKMNQLNGILRSRRHCTISSQQNANNKATSGYVKPPS